METPQTRTKAPEAPKRRRRSVVVASVAFAVVIVVGGTIALMGSRAQDGASAAAVEVIPFDEIVSVARSSPRSMLNTIQPGALLTVDRSAYDSDLPERFDVVLYAQVRASDVGTPPELIARVIALPGETLEIRDGDMYVDGSILDEPYVRDPKIPVSPFGPITLGSDELWAISDNRQQSGSSHGGHYHLRTLPVAWLRGEIIEIANP